MASLVYTDSLREYVWSLIVLLAALHVANTDPWLQYDGCCVIAQPSSSMGEEWSSGEDNSPSDCLSRCSNNDTKFVYLQGGNCVCSDMDYRVTSRTNVSECSSPCPGFPGVPCGNQDNSTWSRYSPAVSGFNGTGEGCLTYGPVNFFVAPCNESRDIMCYPGSVSCIKHGWDTWMEAASVCETGSLQIQNTLPSDKISVSNCLSIPPGSSYWLGLVRTGSKSRRTTTYMTANSNITTGQPTTKMMIDNHQGNGTIKPTLTTTDATSDWKIATCVLGVLTFVFMVIAVVLAIVIVKRKKNQVANAEVNERNPTRTPAPPLADAVPRSRFIPSNSDGQPLPWMSSSGQANTVSEVGTPQNDESTEQSKKNKKRKRKKNKENTQEAVPEDGDNNSVLHLFKD